MSITLLNIINFRNIESANLNLSDHCNIFYGQNGSGKTSILEAIYYLALGRSFRSHLLRRIVKYNTDNFSIFGKIKQKNILIPAGINRSLINGRQIKIFGEEISSHTEITKLIPLQLLNQDSYRLLADGPKVRRQLIDWGLFHVEQDFIILWRKIERIIEQRNAAINAKLQNNQIKTWDHELSRLSLELHNRRKQYTDSLIPIIHNALQKIEFIAPINISYFPGWNIEQDLSLVLSNNLKTDLHLGYTSAGPHRADFKFIINNIPTKDALSRGQQKLFLYILQISQGILLQQLTGKKCLFLIDDLPSELDQQKQECLAKILMGLQTQLFITGLTHTTIEKIFHSENMKVFHMKHGGVNESRF